MKSNKNVLFDKEYVKIKKDTFKTMNKVIDDATNVMNLQPKLEKVYKEVDSYTKSYQSLKRENTLYENEIKVLEFNNNKLDKKNTELTNKINSILKAIKKFFRKLLQFGSELIKEATVDEIKQYFDDKIFKKKDVVDISVGTTKEYELFDYVGYEKYYGKSSYNELDDTYYKDIDSLNKDYYHVLHIGKSSFGWHFSLCIYPTIGINNLDDWNKVWSSSGCKIYTESDEEIPEEELMSYIVNRQYPGEIDEDKALKHNNEMAEKEGIGRRFDTYDQLLLFNGAARGKNGLWAHNSLRYTRTDDTYDLTDDVNFW